MAERGRRPSPPRVGSVLLLILVVYDLVISIVDRIAVLIRCRRSTLFGLGVLIQLFGKDVYKRQL